MDRVTDWKKRIASLDAALHPIANRPDIITALKRLIISRKFPHALDEAGVRADTEKLCSPVFRNSLAQCKNISICSLIFGSGLCRRRGMDLSIYATNRVCSPRASVTGGWGERGWKVAECFVKTPLAR
jgi:hypothetical protein